jgi:hypothetical protein
MSWPEEMSFIANSSKIDRHKGNSPVYYFKDDFFFFSFLETECHYVVQAILELEIFLPQPCECWDYRRIPLHLASQCSDLIISFNQLNDTNLSSVCLSNAKVKKVFLLLFWVFGQY